MATKYINEDGSFNWESLLPYAGAALGAAASKDTTQTQTTDKAPWKEAQPYLLQQLAQNNALQQYYANNPFSAGQKAAYQGQADVLANNMANVENFNQIASNFMGSNRGKMAAMPGLLSNTKATPIDFDSLVKGTSGALASGLLGKSEPVKVGGGDSPKSLLTGTDYGVNGSGLQGQVNNFINDSAASGNFDSKTGTYSAAPVIYGDSESLSNALTGAKNWIAEHGGNMLESGLKGGLLGGVPGAVIGAGVGAIRDTKLPVTDHPMGDNNVDLSAEYAKYGEGNEYMQTGGGNAWGGDAACVHIDSHLPSGGIAGNVKNGDVLDLSDNLTLDESKGVVSYSETKPANGYRISTKSASLICSDTAPIPVKDGSYKHPQDLAGHEVPVMVDGVKSWEPIESIDHVGEIQVQHITVGDRCFWAGEKDGSYILHHNQKGDNTVSASDKAWADYMKSLGL